MHAAFGLEATGIGGLFDEIVLSHVHPALDDAFDAPDAGVIVERRTLAGPPRHDDRRVPERIAAVQEAPGIALRADATKPRRQIDRAIANRVFELSLHAARDCFGIAQAHGGVDARNEVIETVDHHNQYIEQRRLRCADATAARQKIVA